MSISDMTASEHSSHRDKSVKAMLSDLLAVIHRDGGHYESQHGTEKAVSDAIDAVIALRTEESGVQWRKEPPDKNGWWIEYEGGSMDCLEVLTSDNGEFVADDPNCMNPCPVNSTFYEHSLWAGPIEPPPT